MKTTLRIGMICWWLLLTACALEPAEQVELPTDAEVEQYNASVPPEERIVCRIETPVSSNIPRRVCRYIADLEAATEEVRRELMRTLR